MPAPELKVPNRISATYGEETWNASCYYCYELCRRVDPEWYVIDTKKKMNICVGCKDYVGHHGSNAPIELKRKVRRDNILTAMHLRTSTALTQAQIARQKPPPLKVAKDDQMLGAGEVAPEVAEFLRKMGKL